MHPSSEPGSESGGEPGSESGGEPGSESGGEPSTADLTLVPGLRLAARESGLLTLVGGPSEVTVPDTPEVRRLLDDLARRLPVPATVLDDPSSRRALERLVASGLTEAGVRAGARSTARSAARVLVDAGERHADVAIELLLASGVAVTTRRERATHVLVVGTGEVDRERVAEWSRRDIAHLVVADHGPSLTVGPFVRPGHTSCLHCLDAHRRQRDPAYPALVAGLADSAPLTPVADPALRAVAIGWAVRDLVSVVDGGRPSTWSATVTLTVAPDEGLRVSRREWRRHPDCGCAWADLLRPERTG